MKLGGVAAIDRARLVAYACVVTAVAACGGGGGGDITPPNPTVAQVTLSPGSAKIIAGQTASFTAQPKDANGAPINGLVVGWSINDPNVATVSNGTVTGAHPGTAILTATVGNASATAAITVLPAVATVTINPPTSSLLVGQTATLTPTLTDASGTTLTDRTVAWSSNNDAIASVSNGVVTAKTLGTVTITAAVEGKSGTATVEVKSATVTSIAVTSGMVRVGSRLQLRATGTLSDGSTLPLTGSAVAWSSGDLSKATVDADGNVTGVAVGTATITATNPASNKSGSATVTIVAAQSPIITSLAVAPGSVDVRAAAQTITVSGVVSDGSGSGISSIVVTATGHTLSTIPGHPEPTASCTASGTGIGANGAWSCTLTIPRGAAAGQWPITSVVVTDNASHTTTYGVSDVAAAFNAKFTVTSDEDLSAPVLTDITVAPTTVNVASAPQTITMTARYRDDLSGVARVNYRVTSVGTPTSFVECTATLLSGTPTDGTWGCSVTIPQGAPAGNWTQTFTAFDAAFNKLMNTPAALIVVTH